MYDWRFNGIPTEVGGMETIQPNIDISLKITLKIELCYFSDLIKSVLHIMLNYQVSTYPQYQVTAPRLKPTS